MIDSIRENHRQVRARADAACRRSGRDPASVTIIGVTKTKPAETVAAALDAGIADVGENYVQELVDKQEILAGRDIRWHFIGHLQRNKVKLLVPFIHMIHAVDSGRLAAEISRQAVAAGRTIPVLLQVNTSGEESKFGVEPDRAEALARSMAALPGIELQGLMTLAAFLDDPEATRPMFRLLAGVQETLRERLPLVLPHLSMGMTNDFEVAIEEGATMVRVGTAIFGSR
jgi:pyridoxal phosphate enzyme (YggS family)